MWDELQGISKWDKSGPHPPAPRQAHPSIGVTISIMVPLLSCPRASQAQN